MPGKQLFLKERANMSIIDDLNKKFDAIVKGKEVKEAKERTEPVLTIADYKKLQKDKTPFAVTFQSRDDKSNFSAYKDGICIYLSRREFRKVFDVNVRPATYNVLLQNESQVVVVDVDEETKTVDVSFANAGAAGVRTRRPSQKELVMRELNKAVGNGEAVRVQGRVLTVYDDRMGVDIFDLHILGFLYINQWSESFTRSLKDVAKVGDILSFDVTKKADKRPDREQAWLLSRKAIVGNVWDNLNTDGLVEGSSTLIVECVDKPVDKSYWWGKCDRLPGVPIMCNYSDRFSSKDGVVVGLNYVCKLKVFQVDVKDKKDRVIKVSPFDITQKDADKLENYRKQVNMRVEIPGDTDAE